MKRILTAVLAATALLWTASTILAAGKKPAPPSLKFSPRFGDHMVVQRQALIPVEGTAARGTRVTVALADRQALAVADRHGVWRALLPAFEAGGPYTLSAASKSQTVSCKDVLVGEVWIASGQSNMEWILNQTLAADREIKRADHPQLRLFTQQQILGAKPSAHAVGAWAVCAPMVARNFSAVGYFFGRDLQEDLKVPVGVVCAAWGGSAAESWVTEKTLYADPELRPIMKHYLAETPTTRRAWVEGLPVILEFKDMRLIPMDPKAPVRIIGDGDWSAWAKPGSTADFQWLWGGQGGRKIGRYIGKFQAAAWGGCGAPLAGGKADDLTTYEAVELQMRGRGVFKMELTQPSIRDFDYACSAPVTLTKAWQKARFPIASFKQNGWGLAKPFTPNELDKVQFEVVMGPLPAEPAAMFNGMVAPWTKFPARGVIWYQGETNASRAEQYRTLLKALVGDWRAAWHNPSLAFLVVQLPNYDPSSLQSETKVWPELREAQLGVLDLKDTAVVSTLDVGEVKNIHPINKAPVGERLERAALHVAYGRPDGLCPLYDSMRIEGGKAHLAFRNAEGGLKSKGGRLKGFAVAGEDQVFHPAEAEIVKDTVTVWSKDVPKPAAVRYGWADVTDANLWGKNDLPASPFRTDDWPLLTKGRR